MKEETTEAKENASSLLSLPDNTARSIVAGSWEATIKRTPQLYGKQFPVAFSLRVWRTIRVGQTETTVADFLYFPEDLLWMPQLTRDLAVGLAECESRTSVRDDLHCLASCLETLVPSRNSRTGSMVSSR